MTRGLHRWLRLAFVVGAFALLAPPATATAGLAARTGALTERIGHRLQAAPDPIEGLSDAQLAGARLVVGFDGQSAPASLLRRVAAGEVGGVIVFARNLGPRSSIRSLTASFQAAAR